MPPEDIRRRAAVSLVQLPLYITDNGLDTKDERPEFQLDGVDVLHLQLRQVKSLEGNYKHDVVPSHAWLAAGSLKAVGMAAIAGAERRMKGKAETFLQVDLAEFVHP